MAYINIIYDAGSAGTWRLQVDDLEVLDVLEESGVNKIDISTYVIPYMIIL